VNFLAQRETEVSLRVGKINIAILQSGDLIKDGKETAEAVAHKQLTDIYGSKLWQMDIQGLMDFSDLSVSALPPGSSEIQRRDICENPAPAAPPNTPTTPAPSPTSLEVQCEKSSDCQVPQLIDWCGKQSIAGGPKMEAVPMVPGCYQMALPKKCACEDPRYPSP
jgi:hypothetical protein